MYYLNIRWKRGWAPEAVHRNLLLFYLFAITVAESVTMFLSPQIGLLLYALILFILIMDAVLTVNSDLSKMLLALLFAPLLRLLGLAMPLDHFPPLYWYPVVGLPLAIAALLAARVAKMNRHSLGLAGNAILIQILVGLSGIGLGYVEYVILRPEPVISALRWEEVWLPALFLLVFSGFLEEFLFRGLMQSSAVRILGRWGVVYVSILFAVLHLGQGSAPGLFFIFAIGLFFGFVTLRTGSLLGVSLAHGITNITLYLIFPLLLLTPNA